MEDNNKNLLILIVAFSYGHKGKHLFITPYISPGIQIGYNDNNGLILSPQLTIGTGFTFNHFEDTMPFFIGKTFGLKTYYKKMHLQSYINLLIIKFLFYLQE